MRRTFLTKVIGILILTITAAYVGYFYGTHKVEVAWKNFKPIVSVDSQTPPPNSNLDMSLFYEVIQQLNHEYYDKSKIDSQKIVYGAISGALKSLDDPYTSFFPPKENKEFKEQLAGEFSGIGAELGMNDDNLVAIVAPLDGSPAEAAGVKSGDVILQVDGVDTFGWTIQEAVENIRGPRGTEVTLTVGRGEEQETEEISITRDTIQIDSVRSWVKGVRCENGSCVEAEEDGCDTCSQVAYVRVSQFGDRTNNEWLSKLNDIFVETQHDPNFSGIIVDLRNNPGGYMNDAVFIASEFIQEGVVVRQEDGSGGEVEFSVSRAGSFYETPIVVLVNGGSASASEIVAGALRDHGRATIVGEQTFGKGTIQRSIDFNDGESVHITIAKWLTPNGTWVHEDGLTPDIEVEYSEEASEGEDFDNQLQRAILELTQ